MQIMYKKKHACVNIKAKIGTLGGKTSDQSIWSSLKSVYQID